MSKLTALSKAEEKKKSSASSASTPYEKAKQIYQQEQRQAVADANAAARSVGGAQTSEEAVNRLNAYRAKLAQLQNNYGYDISGPVKAIDREVYIAQNSPRWYDMTARGIAQTTPAWGGKGGKVGKEPQGRGGRVTPLSATAYQLKQNTLTGVQFGADTDAGMMYGTIYEPTAQERGRVSNVFAGLGKGYVAGQIAAAGATLADDGRNRPIISAARQEMQERGYTPNAKRTHNLFAERVNEWAGKQGAELFKTAAEWDAASQEHLASAKKGLDAIGRLAVDAGVGLGQMALDATIGRLTGTGMAPLATRVYGMGTREALANDATMTQAKNYGALSAAVEVVAEKMFDVAKIFGGGAADEIVEQVIRKMTSTDAGRTALRVASGFLGEGFEEMFSDILNPVIKLSYDRNGLKDYKQKDFLSNMLYDGLVGGILGLVGGGGQIVTGQNAAANQRLRMQDMLDAAKGEAVNRYAARFGTAAPAVQTVYNMNKKTAVEDFQRGFEAAYYMGREGVAVEEAVNAPSTSALTENQRRSAWEIGRDARTTGAEPVKLETMEGGTGNGTAVDLRRGGERNPVQNPGGEVREVESRAGSETEGPQIADNAKDADVQSVKTRREAVSIPGMREQDLLVPEEKSYTPEMKKALKNAAKDGVQLHFFMGDYLKRYMPDGSVRYSRGVSDSNGNMWVRADDPNYTASQIARHEGGHDLIARGVIDLDDAREKIVQTLGEEAYRQALDDYRDAYDGADMTDEEVFEEIVCDARGGMNIFEGAGVRYDEAAKRIVPVQQAAREGIRERSGKETRGPPAEVRGENKYSYVGERALTADREKLAQAKEMEQRGDNAETIRKETGWFRGRDGKWRFEIDDSTARYRRTGDAIQMEKLSGYRLYQDLMEKMLNGTITGAEINRLAELDQVWKSQTQAAIRKVDAGYAKLHNFLQHDLLFAAYPQLRNVSVVFGDIGRSYARFNAENNRITLSNEIRDSSTDFIKETLLHEVQHAIQSIEGFSKGTNLDAQKKKLLDKRNSDTVEAYERVRKIFDSMPEEIQNRVRARNRAQADRDYDAAIEIENELLNGEYGELFREYEDADFDRASLLERQKNTDYDKEAYERYRNTAGEIEARDTASRRNMNEQQRRETAPDLGGKDTVFAENAKYSDVVTKRDADYMAAVNAGDMEKAGKMVDAAAEKAFANSKLRTPDGKLRKVYHGTNSDEFREFDPGMIGAGSGDSGFFGRGFYFAYTAGEARYYGRRVMEAYLNITNPFNFETELNTLNGERSHDYNGSRAVFAVNFAKKFPELAKTQEVSVWEKDGKHKAIPLEQFANEFMDVYENVKFDKEEMDGAYGKEWLVTAGKHQESYTDEGGNTFTWDEYTYQSRAYDEQAADDKAAHALEYLAKTKYSDIKIPASAEIVMDTDFSEALKKRGYDGAIQSEFGDEAVVFEPEQIKSANPVTYDKNGNAIPISERFDKGKGDINYSRDLATEQLARENRALEREVDTLTKQVQRWKRETKLTKRIELREGDVTKAAKAMIDGMDSTADVKDVAADMKYLAEYILNGGKGDSADFSWTVAREMATEIAEKVVGAVRMNERADVEDLHNDILFYTRKGGKKVQVSENEIESICAGLGVKNLTEFNRTYGDYIQLTIADTVGNGIERVYSQLQEQYPGVFTEDYNQEAMVTDLVETLERTAPRIVTGEDAVRFYDEAVTWAANDVIDRAMDEGIRQMPPTFADKAKASADARVEKARQTGERRLEKQRTRFEERLQRVREQGNERVERTKREYTERSRRAIDRITQRQEREIQKLKDRQKQVRQNERERSAKTATWHKIQKLGAKFRQMAEHPTEAASKHAPRDLAKALQGIADVFYTAERKRSSETLNSAIQMLRTTYSSLKDHDSYGIYYDPQLAEINDVVEKALVNTPVNEMTPEELELTYRLLRAHMHNITNANKFVTGKWAKGIWETGRDWSAEVDGASPVMKGWIGDFLNWQLRPDSFFRRISGFAKDSVGERVQKMFSDGTEKMLKIQQDAYFHFRKYTESKEFDQLSKRGKKDLVDVGLKDENGNTVLLTRDMMLAVYMHLSSEQNLQAATYGGFDVPELDAYYTGRTARSYDRSTRTMNVGSETRELQNELNELLHDLRSGTLSDEAAQDAKARIEELQKQIKDKADAFAGQMLTVRENISKQLTEYEKGFVAAAHEWMQKSADYINAETLAMYGIEKAQVENYWPMHRNTNFVNTDMRTVTDEINLENWGSLKERVQSRAPLKLTGFGFEIDNHTRKMSQFCGFAAAQRDFNKLYNTRLPSVGSSLSEKIQRKFHSEERKMGASGAQYIQAYIDAVSGADKSDATIFSVIRRNLPRATLTLNLRVAVSQLASMPTAAAEVGWGSVAKGLPRGLATAFNPKAKERLAQRDPWFWQRYRGEGGMREFADMKEERNWLDRFYNKAASAPVIRRLVNWCQDFDVFATASMWAMSEEWVKSNTDLKPGTQEFDAAVSAKYADVIRKTQPNYTVTERSGLLRDKREGYKILTMYKTQSNQNLNILYDANATLMKYKKDFKAGKNGVTKADVQEAEKQFARAYTAVLLGGSVTFAVLRSMANALLHAVNRYRDDDDELTMESVMNGILEETISAMAGMFAFGSAVYDIVHSLVTGDKYYGLNESAIEALSNLAEQSAKILEKALDRDKDVDMDDVEKLVKNACNILGIPWTNGKTIVEGIVNHVRDAQNGEFLSFNAGVERTAKKEVNKIVDHYLDGAGDKVQRAWDELLKLKDGDEKKAQEAVRGGIKDAYLAGEITDKQALDLLKRYGGKDGDDAKKDYLMKWQAIKETGIAVDDIDDAYRDGEISKADAIGMLVKYKGKTQEEAGVIMDKIDFEDKYGFEYGEAAVKQAVIDGTMTKNEAMAAWKKFGKRTDEQLENMLKQIDLAIEFPGVDPELIGTVSSQDYYDFGKPAEIPPEKYFRYWQDIHDIHGDDRRSRGIAYIDSLPLSDKQKIAVFLSFWAESSLKYCPDSWFS